MLDTAEGVSNEVWWDYAERAAKKYNFPVAINDTVFGRVNNDRDQEAQRMPQYVGDVFSPARQDIGGLGTLSWNATTAADRALGVIGFPTTVCMTSGLYGTRVRQPHIRLTSFCTSTLEPATISIREFERHAMDQARGGECPGNGRSRWYGVGESKCSSAGSVSHGGLSLAPGWV